MFDVMYYIGYYFSPFLCVVFILSSISLAKKIRDRNPNTSRTTFLVTLSFTLLFCSLWWSATFFR